MRLSYSLELVATIAAGFGLAAWRLTWEDLPEFFGLMSSPFLRFELAADAFLAGVGLAGGAATFIERARRGRGSPAWGPGRWAWAFAATYVVATQGDMAADRIALAYEPGFWSSESTWSDVLKGWRGANGMLLFPGAAWAFVALGAAAPAAGGPRDPAPDAREWSGRAFAVLVAAAWIGLRAALWFGFRHHMMGGGMR